MSNKSENDKIAENELKKIINQIKNGFGSVNKTIYKLLNLVKYYKDKSEKNISSEPKEGKP